MNKRFSLYDIAEILTEKTGVSTAQTERFLQELIALVNEGITKDKSVKLKGVGTFSIVQVKERESVHVNTGERIVIPAHHKLSFQPEKALKELINKPFSLFEAIETTEEGNTVTGFSISSEEDEEDEQEALTPKEEKNQPVTDVEEPSPEEEIGEETEDTAPKEESIEKEFLMPPVPVTGENDEQTILLPPPPVTTVEEILLAEEIKPSIKTSDSRKANKSSIMSLYYAIVVLLLCVLGGCIWYLFLHESPVESFDKQVASTFTLPGDTVIESEVLPDTIDIEPNTLPVDSSSKIKTPPETTTKPVPQKPAATTSSNSKATTAKTPSSAGKILARVKMEPGGRLTLIAEKYYGNKIFWVYIYKYNRTKIGPNPNRIPTGTEILVPAKDVYGINASSQAYEKARALQSEILSGIN
jgi:nucleoid DNA-binding protein/nucleoid-associated protein YgaU